jgi:hypothetical protein
VIDSFKVALRHQNSHAFVNAACVIGVAAGVVSSARVVFGGVGSMSHTDCALFASPASAHEGMYVYVCMCVCGYMYACMHVCLYVCTYACVYVCRYVCMCQFSCTSLIQEHVDVHLCMNVSGSIFEAHRLEAAMMGKALSQATLTACISALVLDINTVGPSTYYGTTDAYRRQTAAALVYKVIVVLTPLPYTKCLPTLIPQENVTPYRLHIVMWSSCYCRWRYCVQMFVRALPPASVNPRNVSAGLRYVRPVSSEVSTFTTADPSLGPVTDPVKKQGELIQVSGEATYTHDVKLASDALHGALAITQTASGVIQAISIVRSPCPSDLSQAIKSKIAHALCINTAPLVHPFLSCYYRGVP